MKYFDLISLWIGRTALVLLGLIVCVVVAFGIVQGLRILFRRPWQSVKHLLPWFWIKDSLWAEYEDRLAYYRKTHNAEWEDVELITKNHFGIMYVPKPKYWWQPKNHYFIIKKG